MSTNLTLEEAMEKKVFVPKGSSVQLDVSSRLRQDVSSLGGNQSPSGVQFPRSKPQNRRSDLPGPSNAVNYRPELSIRKFPSKGKGKGRAAEAFEQVVENVYGSGSAEFGSLQIPGNKKQNLNHLLNFHFAPRETQRRDLNSFHHGSKTVRPKKVNDSFIQANCQFMVASDQEIEYQVDLLVDWKSVEQIIIRTYDGTPGCPICLDTPIAAKITKCGHVFCWTCLLQYFSYGDEHSQPCPICFTPITSQDLKSVVAYSLNEFHVGDLVEVQLICRRKDSTSGSMPVASKLGHNVENWEKRFKKVLPVNPAQVQKEVIEREEAELSFPTSEDEAESLETGFVVAARTELEKRNTMLMEKVKALESKKQGTGIPSLSGTEHKSLDVGLRGDVKGKVGLHENVYVYDTLETNYETPSNEPINWDEFSCFYQATDGSNTFMNPLNMAMLWKHFGQNPSNWPQTLGLRAIEMELMTVTAELRKRLKFLQHVSLNSSIQLVEFELKELVSKEIMSEFSHQLNERKRRRSERVRLEKRRERLQAEADRKANREPRKPKMESLHDFPVYGNAEAEAKQLDQAIHASLAEATDRQFSDAEKDSFPMYSLQSSDSSDFPAFPRMSSSPSLSFAQALNTPYVRKRSPTFPVTTKPTNLVVPTTSRQRGTSESEVEPDGNYVPEFRMSVSDAIASAFATFDLNAGTKEESDLQSSRPKKKGRKKGKVLFATAMDMVNN